MVVYRIRSSDPPVNSSSNIYPMLLVSLSGALFSIGQSNTCTAQTSARARTHTQHTRARAPLTVRLLPHPHTYNAHVRGPTRQACTDTLRGHKEWLTPSGIDYHRSAPARTHDRTNTHTQTYTQVLTMVRGAMMCCGVILLFTIAPQFVNKPSGFRWVRICNLTTGVRET